MRVAIKDSFCNQKSLFCLRKSFCDIKYSGSDIFEDSVLNDKNFFPTSVESIILETFLSQNQSSRKKLDLINMEAKNLADLLCKITDIKVNIQ